MRFLKLLTREQGFTLIELMIVVGIIGILVSIAAPNFSRYQSKARQSEAKIALSAIYGGEKSFYSEYSSYISSMDAIGYSPEGQKRFYGVGWSALTTGTIAGYGGTITTASFGTLLNTFVCTAGNTPALPGAALANAQTFLVGASGCIRTGAASSDNWNITDTKILSNNVINL